MIKNLIYTVFFCSVLLFAGQAINAQDYENGRNSGSLTIDLTDGKRVHTQEIGRNLLLRVVKDSSVRNKNFGWLIEVVRKPYRRNSENLIYQNRTGNTADLSQVYAWHIKDRDFPNERKLRVKGSRHHIKITLLKPKTKGNGADAKFTGGKMRISW